jgi:hypothetical protein
MGKETKKRQRFVMKLSEICQKMKFHLPLREAVKCSHFSSGSHGN